MPRISTFVPALLLGLAAATAPTHAATAEAAPTHAPSESVRTHAPRPDHAPWRKFLSRYLDTASADGVNRVRYGSVTPADKAALDAYLKAMQGVKASALAPDAERAFWINLYNARTVAAVLQAYPVKSIRDIRLAGEPSQGPWDAKLLKVEGKDLSLNDIENGILRKRWKDNRIHFALNCASIGCPNLSPLAFTAANLEAQLEKGAKDFLQSPRGLEFKGGILVLSSIFDWYKGDFGKDKKEVLETISRFTSPETAKRLKVYSGKIEYQYDWNLNGI